MMPYILTHENPAHVSSDTEFKLHNIITQQIMSDEIRFSILSYQKTGQDLYDTFRKERFVQKSKRLADTIHRTNLKTFKSIHAQKRPDAKKKDQKKESAEAQKIVDLARVRDYDIKHLFEYDLVQSSYLFDNSRFMTDPKKSMLCTEMEKI
jgi:hypothetical protein